MPLLDRFIAFFRTGRDRPPLDKSREEIGRIFERRRWSVFLSVTLGYGFFYVCRINFSVVKKPLIDEGLLTATQMGVIGSAMLVTYAVGKFMNGILADHSNIRRFMSAGLLASALVNLAMGSTSSFIAFIALWGMNGWFQSMGGAPSVVSLSHWFTWRERGTRYGVWSISHSFGEGFTFIVTAFIVSIAGWRWGFIGPGFLCASIAIVLLRTLCDRPQTYGLPAVSVFKGEKQPVSEPAHDADSVGRLQMEVIRNPVVWILGLSSAAMYVARYGINNWGIFYLQEGKGYSLVDAGAVLAVFPLASIAGSSLSGWISDRFFGSRRNLPTLIFGLGQTASLVAFHLIPAGHIILDSAAMAVFGFTIGGLLVFVGGLIAIDIVSHRAAGIAAGTVGMFSYLGAAFQDSVTGYLMDAGRSETGVYSFDDVFLFWIGASILSILLACSVWNVRPKK